ncbi:hypothetical protein EYF80_033003 [Liparis tanakae]|uniref:Uncharacterized protein n=1 Tax=Liparis tanakae TaxID=230148 RepID=A0A4Z2GUC0_9TELE|nr:hypothetical protein EYF80_033003 [Liparis tanakae]
MQKKESHCLYNVPLLTSRQPDRRTQSALTAELSQREGCSCISNPHITTCRLICITVECSEEHSSTKRSSAAAERLATPRGKEAQPEETAAMVFPEKPPLSFDFVYLTLAPDPWPQAEERTHLAASDPCS